MAQTFFFFIFNCLQMAVLKSRKSLNKKKIWTKKYFSKKKTFFIYFKKKKIQKSMVLSERLFKTLVF